MSDGEDPVQAFMLLDDWPSEPVSEENDAGELYLVGFLTANVVGLRFYSGKVNGGEVVNLVRQPLNVYDSNAIQVLNIRSQQVGHIEASAAKVISPLVDSGVITIEGIVPKMSWGRNRYKIACQVHIFARMSEFDTLKSIFLSAGLDFISMDDPTLALSEAAIVKEEVNAGERKSIDEIFKLLDEKVGKNAVLGTLDPPNAIIKSELLPHQKEGLWWLVQQEKAHDLPPFWEERNGLYVNVLTNYCMDNYPDPIRGGIFADDMGLGKTLTLISLIAFDKYEKLEEKENVPVASISKGSRPRKKIKSEGTQTKLTSFNIVSSSNTRTTLVVCPPAVFSVWITQLEEHTKAGSLKVYLYYGTKRTGDANELQKYDIVLTTYNTLATEDALRDSPLKMIEWWRVVLDEAHVIKNVNAQQSRAVNNLKAKRRWVVTGTPIQNGSFDLYSFMAFLRVEPLSVKNYWNSLIQRPLSHGDQKGIVRLQALMETLSLRRTKDKTSIGLPAKTIETYFVQLSEEEREIYDKMELRAKKIIKNYMSEESSMKNYWTVVSALVRLRQICADVALVPAEVRDLLPTSQIENVQNNPELLSKMLMALQDDDGLNCPICLSPPKDTVITCCAHIFCKTCILKTLQQSKPSCPMCRRPLTESNLFFAPTETSKSDCEGNGPSSKVVALIDLLLAERERDPTVKSIVFSQFRSMLHLLDEPLKAAGFKIQRLDGSMNANKRAQVIREFGIPAPEGATVLLASLKASGVGINLTMASRVYLFDPWWNPAVEEQAMDRVHRIGQKEEVKIVRMIAVDTIEERILQLQEKKKVLAREVFRKKPSSRDQRDISVDDLITLMNL
ncbi:unnamed protein product [Cuscuta epithymum]|uniref:SWI/SNF-related matrix-associated actin-dependent regulator of chromatin subfamily A member 3-like 1 n=1 Tax=Cuscuta epithymum TaxID=186058 RepID=A0AAV0EWB0_9ASTE|nr:unnamed protein product [Cuscuta epithymum]